MQLLFQETLIDVKTYQNDGYSFFIITKSSITLEKIIVNFC